jgi:hypothetical protein
MLKEHDDIPPGNPKSEPRNPDKRRRSTSAFPETNIFHKNREISVLTMKKKQQG